MHLASGSGKPLSTLPKQRPRTFKHGLAPRFYNLIIFMFRDVIAIEMQLSYNGGSQPEMDIDIEVSQKTYAYLYELKDHLGNVRVVFDRQSNIHRYAAYYPFGLKMASGGMEYRYGYQGEYSEEDQESGLNHFEARQYDPVIGRWMSVDPAMQYWSPYLGMGNDPVNGVDPDGRKAVKDEFTVDKNTGTITKISDLGGDKTDYYHSVITNENGDVISDMSNPNAVVITRNSEGGNINTFRFKETPLETISALHIPETEINGFFMEPKGPSTSRSGQNQRIPEGVYNLNYTNSPSLNGNYFNVHNDKVSPSRRILIHPGNHYCHSRGCLLPGTSIRSQSDNPEILLTNSSVMKNQIHGYIFGKSSGNSILNSQSNVKLHINSFLAN